MYLKFKILVLSLLPVALALAAVMFFVQRQADLLVEQQVAALEARVVTEKQQELENYIELALTSIEPFVSETTNDPQVEAQSAARIKRILENLTFSEDGYFFVYDMEGTSILHPKQPWRVGENWWDVQDADGVYLIQELVSAAQNGGGFVSYQWEQPTTGEVSQKISYAVRVDRFDWMIGTGVYLDEIDGLVAALRADVEQRAQGIFLLISGIFAACVVGIGAFISALAYRETSFANAALRKLYNKLVDVQEEERSRVSRDLHDGISQILVSAKYELALAKTRMAKDPEEGTARLEGGFARIDEAIHEVRRISADLRPKDLDDLGLAAALRSLGARFEDSTGLATRVSTLPVNDLISPEQKSALYRIAQEALTNIRRHAAAELVEVHLDRDDEGVTLVIYDDGQGLGPRSSHDDLRGMGLRNMEERLAAFEGKLTIGRRTDGETGTMLRVEMPANTRPSPPTTILTPSTPMP
ncbi:MAG: cache domain-containing protein [Pseudomonadota bacterium]